MEKLTSILVWAALECSRILYNAETLGFDTLCKYIFVKCVQKESCERLGIYVRDRCVLSIRTLLFYKGNKIDSFNKIYFSCRPCYWYLL